MWRENTGTECTQHGWRKLADNRKGENPHDLQRMQEKDIDSLNPLRSCVMFIIFPFIFETTCEVKPVRHLPETTDLNVSLQFIPTLQTHASWSCLEMYNSSLACTWVNIYYPILLSC